MSAATLARCRCVELGEECPRCARLIARAEERDLPVSGNEWDELEAGPLWHSYPGMGAA